MRKNLTRTGRHSLPVVFMQLFILATGASAQATGKISLEGRNITFASVFRNIKNQIGLTVFYSNKLIDNSEKGEAYFELMPDQSKPFKVMTHSGEITVTGTYFSG